MKEELFAFLSQLNPSWRELPLLFYTFGLNSFSFADLEEAECLRRQGKKVICLWEDVWIRKNALVRMRLAGEIGGRERIFARSCTLQKIQKEEADLFFEATHLLGSAKAKHRYGLFYQNQLVAAAAFSGMRMVQRDKRHCRSAEWVRYASLPRTSVTGGMSKLLAAFVAEHHPDDVMSYANKEWSEGAAYLTLGFEQAGETPLQSYWLDPQTMQRYPKKRHPIPQPYWKEVFGMGSLKFIKTYSK